MVFEESQTGFLLNPNHRIHRSQKYAVTSTSTPPQNQASLQQRNKLAAPKKERLADFFGGKTKNLCTSLNFMNKIEESPLPRLPTLEAEVTAL
jgi:hypothetical protein